MHSPDAFDMDDAQDDEDDIACNRCMQHGLYWQETYDATGQPRPKLFENGKPHVCKPSADDFEVTK